MKKILFMLALLMMACSEPEVKPVSINTNTRTQHLCSGGYDWVMGAQSVNWEVTVPHISFRDNLNFFTYNTQAPFSAGVKPTGGNYFLRFKVENTTGTATFRVNVYANKPAGPWYTLAPGQSHNFTRVVPECDVSYPLKFPFSILIERLTCGVMGGRVTLYSVDAPHTTPTASNDFVDSWPTGCTL